MGKKLNNRKQTDPGGRKAGKDEVRRRIELCAELILLKQLSRWQIQREFARRYKLCSATVDNIYISGAKQLLQERARMSRGQARDFGVNILLDVVRTGDNRERTLAIAKLADIFGLDAPKRTELSGPNGGAIETVDLPPHISRARLLELAGLPPDPPLFLGSGNGNGHQTIDVETKGTNGSDTVKELPSAEHDDGPAGPAAEG